MQSVMTDLQLYDAVEATGLTVASLQNIMGKFGKDNRTEHQRISRKLQHIEISLERKEPGSAKFQKAEEGHKRYTEKISALNIAYMQYLNKKLGTEL